MRLRQENTEFNLGYNTITQCDGIHSEMMMDFGVLKMNTGLTYTDDRTHLERVYLLMYGEVEITYGAQTIVAKRGSYLNDNIWCLNVPQGVAVSIKGIAEDSEVAIMRTENETIFPATIRCEEEGNVVNETRGKGFMNEAGTRLHRLCQAKQPPSHHGRHRFHRPRRTEFGDSSWHRHCEPHSSAVVPS